MKKENSIQSQKLQYNNILDELCPSVSSSKSNFSLNRINAYSKKTHKSKFGFNKKKWFIIEKINLLKFFSIFNSIEMLYNYNLFLYFILF